MRNEYHITNDNGQLDRFGSTKPESEAELQPPSLEVVLLDALNRKDGYYLVGVLQKYFLTVALETLPIEHGEDLKWLKNRVTREFNRHAAMWAANLNTIFNDSIELLKKNGVTDIQTQAGALVNADSEITNFLEKELMDIFSDPTLGLASSPQVITAWLTDQLASFQTYLENNLDTLLDEQHRENREAAQVHELKEELRIKNAAKPWFSRSLNAGERRYLMQIIGVVLLLSGAVVSCGPILNKIAEIQEIPQSKRNEIMDKLQLENTYFQMALQLSKAAVITEFFEVDDQLEPIDPNKVEVSILDIDALPSVKNESGEDQKVYVMKLAYSYNGITNTADFTFRPGKELEIAYDEIVSLMSW